MALQNVKLKEDKRCSDQEEFNVQSLTVLLQFELAIGYDALTKHVDSDRQLWQRCQLLN